MARDPLEREYGVLLGMCGPQLMERSLWYRRLADRVRPKCPKSASYLEMQAERAENTIDALAQGLENAQSTRR